MHIGVRRYTGEALAALIGLGCAYLVVTRPALLLIVFGAAAALVVTVRRPVWTLLALAVLLLVEGALRKWLLPGLQEWIYLAKDGATLLLGAVLLVSATPSQQQASSPIPMSRATSSAIAVLAAYLALQIVNPRNPSLAMYAFGVRSYLMPLVLPAAVPLVLGPEQAERLWRGVVLAAVPLAVLAAVQALLPPEHGINRYVGWAEMAPLNVAVMGTGKDAAVRATSTFSYISGFTAYLAVAAATAPAMLVGASSRLHRWGWAAVVAIFVALILTGSRGPVVQSLLTLAVVTLPLWRRTAPAAAPPQRWLGGTAGALGVAAVAAVLLQQPMTKFAQRVQTTQHDVDDRMARIVTGFATGAAIGGAFGWGPGTMHQSRDTLLRLTGAAPLPNFIEEETGRITVELGVVGAPLWYMLLWTIIVAALRRYRAARLRRDTRTQTAALATILLTAQAAVGGLVYNVYLYYFWAFWLGIERTLAASPRKPNSDTASAAPPTAAAAI